MSDGSIPPLFDFKSQQSALQKVGRLLAELTLVEVKTLLFDLEQKSAIVDVRFAEMSVANRKEVIDAIDSILEAK